MSNTPRHRLQKKVHAEYGAWTEQQTPEGREYVGRFDDRTHALGTLRYFIQSNWLRNHDYEPERDGRVSVVRLRSCNGDNLGAFEEWWTQKRGNPPPKLIRRKMTALERARMDRELQEAEYSTLAFQPGPHALSQSAIRQLTWEGLEGGYIAATLPTPESAFQVALYLRDKHYITESDFWQLNHDVKHPDEDRPLRVVIPPEHAGRFEEEFPQAGAWKPGIGGGLLERMATLSNRPDKPQHTR